MLLIGLRLARSHRGVTRFKSSVSSTIEGRLHDHFDRAMKTDRVPLFKSFDVYKKSLPVRGDHASRKILPLYTLLYWVYDEDITYG